MCKRCLVRAGPGEGEQKIETTPTGRMSNWTNAEQPNVVDVLQCWVGRWWMICGDAHLRWFASNDWLIDGPFGKQSFMIAIQNSLSSANLGTILNKTNLYLKIIKRIKKRIRKEQAIFFFNVPRRVIDKVFWVIFFSKYKNEKNSCIVFLIPFKISVLHYINISIIQSSISSDKS